MKIVHYRNIGLPKTGTTWLWIQFMRNPYIDGINNDQLKEFRPETLKLYKAPYENFNYTANFNTHAFRFIEDVNHYCRPENIHNHTTHITMSLRNPYEQLNSMYNFMLGQKGVFKTSSKKHDYCTINGKMVDLYANMKKMFEYWSKCKLPIKYMFFDDLKENPKQYVHDIFSYIGVKPHFYDKLKFQLKTTITDPVVFDDQELINYINTNISLIEDKTQRDLSHWKK